MKLFIAETSPIVTNLLVTALEEVKEVTLVGVADDSNEAMRAILKLKPDVVILDTVMSDGKGLGILRQIKLEKMPPRVIVFTNCVYPQHRSRCLENGADLFLDKSTDFYQIVETLIEWGAVHSSNERSTQAKAAANGRAGGRHRNPIPPQ